MPYAVRILSVSFGQVREDVIRAARDLGAGPVSVARTAYLPVLKPGLSAAFLIVFVLSIEEFALSFVIGSPDFITIPTILYSYLGYDFIRPNAAVVALILVVPNVALMLVLERLLQSANPANISGKG
jgi:putative spermidine/putrescine transport system permease protein